MFLKRKDTNELKLINEIEGIIHNEDADNAVEDIKRLIRDYRSARVINAKGSLSSYYGGTNPND